MKTYLLLFILIFSFSFTSAFLDITVEDTSLKEGLVISDSAMEYPSISIKDWFGIGSTKADLVLTEHTSSCGQDCFSEFTITTYGDSPLVDDVKFYRLDEGKNEERNIRSYQFQYYGDVKDYTTECKLVYDEKNASEYESCNQVESGSHKDWINYNLGEQVKAGTYDVKLLGQKASYMSIDWIIETQGKIISEWATWGNISTGSQAEVRLNSPANNSIQYTTLVTTNASANITNGATIVNTTLWDNSTGTWGARNVSTSISSNATEAHGVTLSSSSTATALRGMNISIGSTNLRLINITKNPASQTDGNAYLYNGSTLVATATFSGDTASFSPPPIMNANGKYAVVIGSNGAVRYAGTTFPITETYFNWTKGIFNGLASQNDEVNDIESIGISFGATSGTQTFVNNYTAGQSYLSNYQFCDSDGDCGFATNNYSFSVDSTPPQIALNYPTALINYGAINGTLNLSITATDSNNLDDVWYNYNGTNITIAGAVSGVANLSNITLSSKKNVTIYANDTAGNINSSTFSWDYSVFENSQSYNLTVYETQITNFAINLTYDNSASLTAILNYDGVNYTAINTGSGNNGYFTSNNFNIPIISLATNKTFYWLLNYNNSIITTPSLNQIITPLVITQCNGTYPTITLNFTFYEELNQTIINATSTPITFLFNLKYWIGDGSIKKNYSFQNLTSTLNNYQFCIGENITYHADADLQYYAVGYVERTFYLRNASLTNTTQGYLLYNLLGTESTKFITNVKQSTEVFTGALVQVWKYYVGLNAYKLIMVGLTDDKGKFTANIDLDQSYNFTVIKEGINYGSFIKTSTCAVTPCEIDLNVQTIILNPNDAFYAYFAQNVDYNLTQNDTTQIVTLNFIDQTGTAQYWRLLVTQGNTQNDTILTVCDSKSYSASGSLTCNYTGYDGDLKAEVFISRSPEKLVDFLTWVNNLDYKVFGTSAILASIIIILVIFFTGIRNPVNALILIPFALVILKFLQFMPLDWSWILGILVFDFWMITRLKT